MTTYIGFAFSDNMVRNNAVAAFSTATVDEVADLVASGDYVSCCNPSHTATIDALRGRFDISVTIPEKAPLVTLEQGDVLFVLKPTGLPRLVALNRR
jgi:hypothetical protein